MNWRMAFLFLTLAPCLFADDQEKTEKKALEQQAKTLLEEAKALENSGQQVEAKARYAAALAFKDSKDATEAIKRIDERFHHQVKDALKQAHALYDQGRFKEVAETLETALASGDSTAVVAYDLAICYRKLGDSATSLAYLEQAATATPDPKRRLKLKQLRTNFTTGEDVTRLSDGDRERITAANRLTEALGFDSTLEDGSAQEETEPQDATARAAPLLAAATLRSSVPTVLAKPGSSSGRNSSLCETLAQMKSMQAGSPALTFDLANCAEDNGRLNDAYGLLQQYLAAAPNAADAQRIRIRAALLNALLSLPDEKGIQVRSLYGAASRAIEGRNFDRALAAFQKAAAVLPEFPPTQWKLALFYEATGNVEQARSYFVRYRELETDPLGWQEADLHLESLNAKKAKYDEEVEAANDVLSGLLNRAMNLTFNGLEDRKAVRGKRARLKGKERKDAKKLGGFTVPFAYARQQLVEAGDRLSTALTVFPLGAEANQLMAQLYLQANDGQSAMRSFDAVVSQNLPAAFYGEMRGHKQDRAVKCELTPNHVRLIFLSFYDKNGRAIPPTFQAGEDGLGDLAIDPDVLRETKFESLELAMADIKKVESKTGVVRLKLTKEDIDLSVIYLPGTPPVEGPQARRFSNTYTRLFARYPGLEDSKLGNEGLTGGEKFKLAYHLAEAGYTIATSLNPMGSFAALQAFIKITREIRQTRNSLRVNFAGWEKTIEDQQELQEGNTFKLIPTEPAGLGFVEETK
ncbi:MAG TPA: tetratricopeptide repeat protein [Candidatus Angelobacter sp.]